MNSNLQLENILFLDIETVPQYDNWDELTNLQKELFEKKTAYQRKDEISPEDFYERAGIWAEFGKIICISVAYFVKDQLRVTSYFDSSEKQILNQFKNLLEQHFYRKNQVLCAHNGKEFDFPFIARRMIVHGIDLPNKLNLFGKKPWEVPHLDTMELWKFGDFKHYTSLELLTHTLGIDSPKEDISGADVANVYYRENDIQKIVRYCENDTIAIAQCMLRFLNKSLVSAKDIIRI